MHAEPVTAVELLLVRHAQAEGSDADDPALSPLGHRQAAALGTRLAGTRLAGILHSPRLRAAQTARVMAVSMPGVPVQPSGLLDDRTPVPSADRRGEYPSRYHPWLDETAPDERDVDGVGLTRALDDLVDEARRRADTGSLVLVTHSFVIGWFVREALGAPAWRWMLLHPANASVTVMRCGADGIRTLATFNDHAHVPA